MAPTALLPFLDPHHLAGFGAISLLIVCGIVFAETGLLVGFILPGDTLLVIMGILTFNGAVPIPIWWVCLAISFAAFLGGEVGYLIGHKVGPRIFERKESGLFSRANVVRTNQFFERFGGLAVIIARFVPIVRTFAPIAAGVGHMSYRKYSLYNIIGAFIWGSGVTLAGFLLGYIPPVAAFVEKYIDMILIGAVLIAVVPTAFHYVRGARKARRAREEGTDADGGALTLDRSAFDQDRSNDKPAG
ncbi:VTT domain-containing protein [Galbitalea sp. SE-J8]|uniref:DedA family protein n=1 Tax=Galbitalea sp. SE-J8 TaxID=3054952 RepID=UPI00259CCB63|nr:VTT domain-containing protein [Galbitalea sp. SE-J8]MDM4763559.1 VTT domain-containing protein [Galbitalea sp. SE-J8]